MHGVTDAENLLFRLVVFGPATIVVACSEPRAQAHLRALDHMPRDEWTRQAPAACADWGLSRMRADPRGPAVIYPDGRGGEHWRFLRGSPSYRWELP